MTPEESAALRAAIPPESIGKLPKGNTTLDYCGHAAVTDRLLSVDPEWNWEPMALAADGTPLWAINGNDAVMWIKLTVCGVTRLGVGTAKASSFELEKQLISDALRNAAMRFGVALDLWSKEELPEASGERQAGADEHPKREDPAPVSARPVMSANQLQHAQSRVKALQADNVSVFEERRSRGLPKLDERLGAEQWAEWLQLIADLESTLEKPFVEAS